MINDNFCLFINDPPKDFQPMQEVAGCFCEYQNEILLLKRVSQSSQGESWGLPAGRLEVGESPKEGIIRETYEETGLNLDELKLEYLKPYFIRRLGEFDYIYHQFHYFLESKPKEIKLNPYEHVESKWSRIDEALKLPLMQGAHEIFKEHY